MGSILVLLLLFGITPAHARRRQSNADRVIIVSVDGLRPDAITALGPDAVPNFYRLRNEGATTDNARSDATYTITLPNHTTMLTGRFVSGADGHNWYVNDDTPESVTLHTQKGAYVASLFDVAHDNGLRTGFFVSKTKFSLYERSYSELNGAPDVTGADNGRGKIDVFQYETDSPDLIPDFESEAPFDLTFFHIRETDTAGHDTGWDITPGSPYMDAVVLANDVIGEILRILETDPDYAGRTLLIVTSDHGGIGHGHEQSGLPINFTIPFYVWGPDVHTRTDLYSLNPSTRTNPGDTNPWQTDPTIAIRNGDLANLSLFQLGLPAVPGSNINPNQDLSVTGTGNLRPWAVPTITSDGATIQASADASHDTDGTLQDFTWDFGDGYTASGSNVAHTYARAGTYAVTLDVRDDAGGRDVATTSISVGDAGTASMSFQDGVFPTSSYAGTSDTKLRSDHAGTAYGSEFDLAVDGSPPYTTLIRWDVSALPQDASISLAEIELNVFNGSLDRYPVYGMRRAWSESSATWVHAASGDAWQSAGALGLSDRYAEPIGYLESTGTGPATITLNAFGRSLMEGWISNPSANYGVVIEHDGSEYDGIDMTSSEASPADARPKLTILYATGDGQQTNVPPTARFDITGGTRADLLDIAVDASASTDPDGTIERYDWIFGDGHTAVGKTAAHVYSAAGTYDVRLVVRDDGGAEDALTRSVTVGSSDVGSSDIQEIAFQDGVSPTSAYAGTADTRLLSDHPSTTYGDMQHIEVDGLPDDAALVHWSIDGIPGGARVLSAELDFDVINPSSDTYGIFAASVDWSETEATWEVARTGQPWGGGGASSASDHGVRVGELRPETEGPLSVMLNAEGRALVQRWIEEPSSNRGLLIQEFDAATDGAELASREADDPAARPRLVVRFAIGTLVGVNAAPTATFELSDLDTMDQLDIRVDATSSTDPDGRIVDWLWDFGDGNLASGPVATHRYDAAGTHAVTLSVTDDRGATASSTQSASVQGSDVTTSVFRDGLNGYSGTVDTKIRSDHPDTNYGGYANMQVDGEPSYATLLKWDVGRIPAGARILSADIVLTVFNPTSDIYDVRPVARAWSESSSTWNMASSSAAWQTPGAAGTTDRSDEAVAEIPGMETGVRLIPLNETGLALVKSWVTDPATNHGLIIQPGAAATDGFDFWSREHTDAAMRPELRISWTATDSGLPVVGRVQQDTGASANLVQAGELLQDRLGLEPTLLSPDALVLDAASNTEFVLDFEYNTTVGVFLPDDRDKPFGWMDRFLPGSVAADGTAGTTYRLWTRVYPRGRSTIGGRSDDGTSIPIFFLSGGAKGQSVGNETAEAFELPAELSIRSAFPDPFADQLTLDIGHPSAASARVEVFDMLGRRVMQLALRAPTGSSNLQLDFSGKASGTYLIRVLDPETGTRDTKLVTKAR